MIVGSLGKIGLAVWQPGVTLMNLGLHDMVFFLSLPLQQELMDNPWLTETDYMEVVL